MSFRRSLRGLVDRAQRLGHGGGEWTEKEIGRWLAKIGDDELEECVVGAVPAWIGALEDFQSFDALVEALKTARPDDPAELRMDSLRAQWTRIEWFRCHGAHGELLFSEVEAPPTEGPFRGIGIRVKVECRACTEQDVNGPHPETLRTFVSLVPQPYRSRLLERSTGA
jgi:hypothetical protein